MFGKLRQILATANEVGRFARLQKQITGHGAGWNDALPEFAELTAGRPGIAAVLQRHGYGTDGKAKLIILFWDLMKGGAGQMVGETLVPLMPLFDPVLLDQLLDMEKADHLDNRAKIQGMAIAALDYAEAQSGKKARWWG